MGVIYTLYGLGVMSFLLAGSIALTMWAFGSIVNHLKRTEQDDDET